MAKRSQQFLFALLSTLILLQSLTASANYCSDSQPQASEQLQSDCSQSCCQTPESEPESCSEANDCNGFCHPHCLCHDLCVTLGITPPAADFSPSQPLPTDYIFTLYAYSPPEPQSLLRPPCA